MPGNLDPLKVKNYLEMLVDHWPSNVPGPNPISDHLLRITLNKLTNLASPTYLEF